MSPGLTLEEALKILGAPAALLGEGITGPVFDEGGGTGAGATGAGEGVGVG